MQTASYQTAFIEMNCIGDSADYVVYQPYSSNTREAAKPSDSVWMVPGSEQARDAFGRKG